MCESIAGLGNDIPATMMARLLKYVTLKRRLQDLVDVEDMSRVSCSYTFGSACTMVILKFTISKESGKFFG